MIEISNVRLPLDAGLPGGEGIARAAVARALGAEEKDIVRLRLIKRSVDARKKTDVHFVASYAVALAGGEDAEDAVISRGAKPPVNVKRHAPHPGFHIGHVNRADSARPVVVGAGPAGLFCAWALAKAGAAPIVLERGEAARERLASVEAFAAGGALNPESNIQFGEGGAGLFSDGKLTTNVKNPRCADALHIFAQAGAPGEILWQAKPHIGTDKLLGVVERLREQIADMGGEVRCGARFEGFRFEDGRLAGVSASEACADGGRETYEMEACACVLSCGHSARDTFAAARDAGLLMERKPFSVGVRIEHPQALINHAQYGDAAAHPALGAADYKLAVHLDNGRGVYTFCMCPGGEVVCAASEEGGVCVNGMSRFARDGENANAAVLVGVDARDLPGDDVLAGVELQRSMERAAYAAGGGTYAAPAQRVGDFLARRATSRQAGEENPVQPTHARGVSWGDMRDVLPDFVAEGIAEALPLFDRRLRGFASLNAVMTGVETRSSSPVRIVRDKDALQAFFADGSPCAGVFPCGEGAGYAGGIMSAAADGLRVAEAVAASLRGR